MFHFSLPGFAPRVLPFCTALLLLARASSAEESPGAAAKESNAANVSDFFLQSDKLGRFQPGVVASTVRVSPDGKKVAQMNVGAKGEQFVWINEWQSPAYEAVGKESVQFSADSQRTAYGAIHDGKKVMVVDGKEYPAAEGGGEGTFRFSPDAKRFGYLAAADSAGEKVVVVIDGVVSEPWESVQRESLAFSADSQHVAYIVKDGDYARLVLDGIAGPKVRNIAAFAFSPSGKHHAYVAIHRASMSVFIDGSEVVKATAFVNGSLGFDNDSRLHILALEDSRITRVQADIFPTLKPPAR